MLLKSKISHKIIFINDKKQRQNEMSGAVSMLHPEFELSGTMKCTQVDKIMFMVF